MIWTGFSGFIGILWLKMPPRCGLAVERHRREIFSEITLLLDRIYRIAGFTGFYPAKDKISR